MYRTAAPDEFMASTSAGTGKRRITSRYEHDPWVVEVAPVRVPAHGPVFYLAPRPTRKAKSWTPTGTYPDLPDFEWRKKEGRRGLEREVSMNHRFAVFRALTLIEIGRRG